MYLRRVEIFLAVVFVVFAALVVRLWHIQVVCGRDYRNQYESRTMGVEVLPARRGRILDRTGSRPLAVDEPCFEFCLDYRFISLPDDLTGPYRSDWPGETRKAIRSLAGESDLSVSEVLGRIEQTRRLAERVAAGKNVDLQGVLDAIRNRVEAIARRIGCRPREAFWAHAIVPSMDEAEAVALKSQLEGTVGASIRPSHRRFYPYGDLACHLIGLTGSVHPDELESMNLGEGEADFLSRLRFNYQPGDAIGKSGVEKMCETMLRGKRGYRRYSKLRADEGVVSYVPARHGRDVRLTIDIQLQQVLTREFHDRGQTGSAVVISVPDGEVLAMVSVPTYDLNEYHQIFSDLASDEADLPLMNRAIARRYPPGSTAKVIVALAALSSGAVSADRRFNCTGLLFPAHPDRWRCWRSSGHGSMHLVEAIKQSCNVYFYNVGELVGGEQLCRWFSYFGYDSPCGTLLPGEQPGLVPSAEWLRENRGREFRPGDARLMAIGQGMLEVTPLHVANAMATIARGGAVVSPSVVRGAVRSQAPRRLPVDKAHLELVAEGMMKVVNEPGGTAYKAFHPPGAPPLDVVVCGKTGTAETAPHRVDSDDDGRITKADRIVRSGNTAWFAGFAPRHDAQIAFAVAVEHVEGGGSVYAAPVARRLVLACRDLGYVNIDGDRHAGTR